MIGYGPVGEMDHHDLEHLAGQNVNDKRRTRYESELIADVVRVAQEALWLYGELSETASQLAKEMGASVMYKSQRDKALKRLKEAGID